MFWRPLASHLLFHFGVFSQGYQKAILGKEARGRKRFSFPKFHFSKDSVFEGEHSPKHSGVYGKEQ